jgi:hypothetical protein
MRYPAARTIQSQHLAYIDQESLSRTRGRTTSKAPAPAFSSLTPDSQPSLGATLKVHTPYHHARPTGNNPSYQSPPPFALHLTSPTSPHPPLPPPSTNAGPRSPFPYPSVLPPLLDPSLPALSSYNRRGGLPPQCFADYHPIPLFRVLRSAGCRLRCSARCAQHNLQALPMRLRTPAIQIRCCMR